MMKKIYTFALILFLTLSVQAQLTAPKAVVSNIPLNWGLQTKSAADTCGAYYNNYIGLGKTSSLRIERMRLGNVTESGQYNGRSQRFSTPQPIEVSGLEFYSYIDNSLTDSIMVVTLLNDYDLVLDSIGAELARDTVYVTHDSFNPMFDPLPSISVQSQFDTPIVVTADYMVSIYTPTDDSLRIIANDPNVSDGAGEGLGFALYGNTNYASFIGWYDMLIDFSADYDFLIAPLVSYKIQNAFELSDSVNCLNTIDHTCADYNQVPAFLSKQYNSNFANALSSIQIDWDDASTDTGVDSICHTYSMAGLYSVNITDTLHRWGVTNTTCLVDLVDTVLINSPSFTTVMDTVCENYTGPSGQIWTVSGTYHDTLVNAVSCDSIITFELVINSPSASTVVEDACGSYTSPSGQIWTASGTYVDTISNVASCDSIITFQLTITPLLTANVSDTVCYGFTNSDGQVWNTTGIYVDTIQSSNASCDSIIITYDLVVVDSIDISFTFTQSNLDAIFTTTANNVDSVWWDFGDNSAGSSDFNPTHTYPGPGTYNVWLYSFNECMTSSLFTTITILPNSISSSGPTTFSMYPNPANHSITLDGISDNSSVSIYNIAGKVVYFDSNLNNKSIVNTRNFANGTYFVSIQSGDRMMTRKMTITH